MRARAAAARRGWAWRGRRARAAPTWSSSGSTLGADGTRATLRDAGRADRDRVAAGRRLQPGEPRARGRAWRSRAGCPPTRSSRGAADVAVPGRLERVANERGVLCVVDYAHTPDALERAIAAMRAADARAADRGVRLRRRSRSRQAPADGRDRGARRRPGDRHVGQPAHRGSGGDRRHDPRRRAAHERAELRGGRARGGAARGYHAEVDRRAAIRAAAGAARPGDVLLIAGKGHEDYQILGTTKHPLRRSRGGGGGAGGGS